MCLCFWIEIAFLKELCREEQCLVEETISLAKDLVLIERICCGNCHTS
jgi:hypothetical protein